MDRFAKRVRWLVQRPPPGDDSPTHGQIAGACEALDIEFQSIHVEPGDSVRLPPWKGPTVIHGRNTLLRWAMSDSQYRRALFYEPERFTPEASQRAWGSWLLNAKQRIVTWRELLEEPSSAEQFVRPNSDEKLFTGRVYQRRELRELYDALSSKGLAGPADRVVVASPIEIDAEARAFVVAGRVIAGSFYRPRQPGPLPQEIVALVERAAARWSPAPVFVLDVARSDRRNWLLETNCFHASRLYDSDVVAIVQHVSAYVATNG